MFIKMIKWIPKPRFMPGIRVVLIWRIEALILHLQTANIKFQNYRGADSLHQRKTLECNDIGRPGMMAPGSRGLPRGSKKSVDKGEPRRTSWWHSSGHFIREEYLACRGREN